MLAVVYLKDFRDLRFYWYMTHYKKDWFIKGAVRLINGKLFIIDTKILASFLIYCIPVLGANFKITVHTKGYKSIIIPS